jgi:hypothetical protein
MRSSSLVRQGVTARAIIALMRAVPALFTLGWMVAAVIWLVQDRPERAVTALIVAAIAGSFGARIELFGRR